MSQGHEICRNSVFISIRKAAAQKCDTDTSKDEKVQQPILDIEALRTIGRIVRAIKERIEAGQRSETGSDPEAGRDSRSSAPASPDRSENNDREEDQNK